MARIVIDARELRSSTGRYVERLLHYLQEIDNKNDYLVLLKAKDFDGWVPTNKKFDKLICPYKEFTFGEQIGLLIQINKLEADLVHFAIVQQPILYRGATVTTMHDLTGTRFRNPSKNWLVFTIKQFIYVWVNRIVAHKSEAIITPTEFVKQDVAHFTRVNSRKITVTYEAADKIDGEPEPVIGLEHTSFILYVGRPQPHKNLRRLILAFSLLKKSHPDLRLVLAGKTDKLYRQLAKWVEESGIENVIFTGFVSDNQLKWLYQECRAYIFPSLSEGFGLPGLEAMQHGAPVVSSNATCLPEVYGEAALYFNPFDPEDMKDKIGRVLDSNKLRNALIEKGREHIKHFSWRKMAQQTLDIYNDLLG